MSNSCINDFNHTVRTYYKELKKYNPLGRDDERDLIMKAKENNIEARNKVISSNLKYVFNLAKTYKGRGVSIDDLISEGNLGLLKAIDKFDTSKDVRFLTYAVWWVKHSMREFINKNNTSKSIEVSVDGESKDVSSILNGDCDGEEYIEKMLIDDGNNEEFYTLSQRKALGKKILKLDKRSRFIIQSYFGFGKKAMTLEEIGTKLGISKERVSRIKEKSIRIIRSEIMMDDEFSELF